MSCAWFCLMEEDSRWLVFESFKEQLPLVGAFVRLISFYGIDVIAGMYKARF